MKIIYNHYFGTYFSVIAAAIHLGILSKDKKPEFNSIFYLPYFGHKYADLSGNLFYMGIDKNNNEVYALGCKTSSKIIMKIHQSMNKIFRVKEEELIHLTTINENVLFLKLLKKLYGSNHINPILDNYLFKYIAKNYKRIASKVRE